VCSSDLLFAVALLLPLFLLACERTLKEPSVAGHVLSGSATSRVRLEIFSDLQCSSCRNLFTDTVRHVIEDYPDEVSVVYYEFPLSMHEYARPAAQYAVAAAKLGRQQALSVYTEIFKDQNSWAGDGNLEDTVAKALSTEDFLRIRQILRDKDSLSEINGTIDKELQLGKRKGVNGTPTVFVSIKGKEQKIVGNLPYQAFKLFLK
jgi:protein-disulfide isomerase